MLETLFKSIRGIDEKVFTPELKDKLDEMFNEAVDTKAKLIAEEMVEAEKVKLQEQAEQYKSQLDESFNDYANDYKKNLAENVDAFLNSVVENFVNERKNDLDKLLESYKSSTLLQLFEKSTNILGKDLVQVLDPSCNEASNLNKYNSLKESFNNLTEERIKLVKENEDLKKNLMDTICAAVLVEKSQGLTVVQQESFVKLVEMYNKGLSADNFDPLDYANKLDEICDTVANKKTESDDDSDDSDNENSKDKKDSKIEESVNKSGKAQSWRRFV